MQVAFLESYGFENTQAAQAISVCDGDLDKALMRLQATSVNQFYDRLWEKDEDDAVLLEKLKDVPADEGTEHEVRCIPCKLLLGEWVGPSPTLFLRVIFMH